MTNVAVYARYSTDKQRDTSIDGQVRNCTVWAKQRGWKIGTVYDDRAISGSKRDRPEYNRMLADAEAKQVDVLLVDDLSRLSRSLPETLSVLEKLLYWDIHVLGVSDGYELVQ